MPVCGNGVVEEGEECDDGNQVPGDGCRSTCLLEDPPAARLFAGGRCTCVIFPAGNVRCWGGHTTNPDDDPSSTGAGGRICGNGYLHDYLITPAELGDLGLDGTFTSMSMGAGGLAMTILRSDGAVAVAGGAGSWRAGQGMDVEFLDEDVGFVGPASLGGPALQVADGHEHVCALMEGGNLLCWGSNEYGELGYGHTNSIGYWVTPEEAGFVPLDGPVAQVVADLRRTCVRLVDGRVRCWGEAHAAVGPGQDQGCGVLGLGPSFTDDRLGDDELVTSVPAIDLPLPAIDISMMYGIVTALLEDGRVYIWGCDELGPALGIPGYSSIGWNETPAQAGPVDLGEPAVAIAGTCALLESGNVRCWGTTLLYPNPDKTDPVGDDETPASVPPVDLGGPAVQIATSNQHACALLEDGSLRCWGDNHYGQLGYGHRDVIGDDETPAQAGPVPYQ